MGDMMEDQLAEIQAEIDPDKSSTHAQYMDLTDMKSFKAILQDGYDKFGRSYVWMQA